MRLGPALLFLVLGCSAGIACVNIQDRDSHQLEELMKQLKDGKEFSFEWNLTAKRRDSRDSEWFVYSLENATYSYVNGSLRKFAVNSARVENSTFVEIKKEEVRSLDTNQVLTVFQLGERSCDAGDPLTFSILPGKVPFSEANGEIAFAVGDELDVLSAICFFTQRLGGGIGSFREIIRTSNRSNVESVNHLGLECLRVKCVHSNFSSFQITFCPKLNFAVVSAEFEQEGRHLNDGKTLSDIGLSRIVSRMELEKIRGRNMNFSLMNSYSRKDESFVELRNEYELKNVFFGQQAIPLELSEIKDGTPVEYIGFPQIKLEWNNGKLEKKFDRSVIEGLDRLKVRENSPPKEASITIPVVAAVLLLFGILWRVTTVNK